MTAEKDVGLRSSQSDRGDGVDTAAAYTTATDRTKTHRGLSPRHVQLMAIGGSIGVGLWVCLLL